MCGTSSPTISTLGSLLPAAAHQGPLALDPPRPDLLVPGRLRPLLPALARLLLLPRGGTGRGLAVRSHLARQCLHGGERDKPNKVEVPQGGERGKP